LCRAESSVVPRREPLDRRTSLGCSGVEPGEPEKYERAAARWHVRFLQEVPNVDLRENQAVLALLAAIPANRLAAAGLAELLSRRRSCERACEALVRWSRAP
jgi:hypothetical protein